MQHIDADDGGTGMDHGIALGRWVRERRENLGISQGQLAERMSYEMTVDQNWVSQIEGGRRKGMPDFAFIEALATGLRVLPSDVLRGASYYAAKDDLEEGKLDPDVERILDLVRAINWNPERIKYVQDMLRTMVQFS